MFHIPQYPPTYFYPNNVGHPSVSTQFLIDPPRVFKRHATANKKERRRTQSINTAFSNLRTAIPNIRPDAKLSKIKTLKLATRYIEYLMDILSKDDPTAVPNGFKTEIVPTRKQHRGKNVLLE